MVAGPVVVFAAAVRASIPFLFETIHGGIFRQLADFFQHRFPYLSAPALHAAFIDI